MLPPVVFLSFFSLFFVDFVLSSPIGNGSTPVFLQKRDATKYVVSHFMVGNSYPYTQQNWLNDIVLAHQSGVDAFALNVGSDSWQPSQVANAYAAAQQSGTGFKLFLSFDMTSLPCSTAADAATLRNYITTYASHPNQFIYSGRVFASTFSGETCKFGQGSVPSGWSTQFVRQLSGKNVVYFVPAFFVALSEFQSYNGIINGMFNWNSGWPTQLTANSVHGYGTTELESLASSIGATTTDSQYINALASMHASYMGAASPWFFTHYSPQTYNKNWIYLSDDHLYAKRWENLIAMRDQVDIVELISHNDYGESHYMGAIQGAQPNSQAWVNGFDHTAWLEMTSYFATAFKTGSYPTISKDQIFMWSRPHPALANAPDPVPRPTNYQLTMDAIWVVVFATSPATVTLSTSSTQSQTINVGAGMSKLSLSIAAGGYMQAVLERNGQIVIDLKPSGFTFNGQPSTYNFNALVVSSS